MVERLFRVNCVGMVLLGIVFSGGPGCSRGGQLIGHPWETITLEIKGKTLQVEVACDGDSRRLGLMRRATLGENEGMLFLFPETQTLSFWMKNTQVPLSIAFLDEEGKIQEIADMKPMVEWHTRSKTPGKYALEVNQGWFGKNGIAVGDSIAAFRTKIDRFVVR